MTTEIIRNPDELKIISNPNKTISKMAKKTPKSVRDLKDQAITAAYILGGQALGATSNSVIVAKLLSGYNATLQQTAKVLIPAVTGLVFASTKNDHLKQLSLGFGVQSTLEFIKFIVPDFAPQQGFADPSKFVYDEQTGTRLPVFQGVDGNWYVSSPRPRTLPAKANGGEEDESKMLDEGNGEVMAVQDEQGAYLEDNGVDFY